MKILQKFIVFLVIISLILSPILNVFTLRSKQVKALDGGGSWMQVVKDTILDAIAWTISDMILKPLEQKIIDWGLGRKSDANTPFAVTDWVNYFLNALDISSAKFVQEYRLTQYCEPIGISLGSRFQFTTYYFDRPAYSRYAACTIGDIVGNVVDFYRNPQISVYGLDAWDALTQSNNNIFGSYFLAQERWEELAEQEDRAADKTTAVSGGFKNEEATMQTDVDACKENCELDYLTTMNGEEYQTCLNNCEELPGIPIKTKIKNWGANIHQQMENALGADMARLISADEITELVGIIFSALLNKAVSGLGLAFNALTSTTQERERSERKDTYSYLRDFQKTLTPKATKETRSQVLTNIQKGIQQLNRSIIACKEAEMMPYTDWTKNIADILAANVEALYVGLEGVNLKPDFEVLDPRFAPYTVFGYSWGEVPSIKIPDKCREIIKQYYTDPPNGYSESTAETNARSRNCQVIQSGLEPSTPTLNDLRADGTTVWTTNPTTLCSRCMYDHDHLNCEPEPYPPQPYPSGTNPIEPWTELIHQQKDEFWWYCKNTYNNIINRCDDCLKKADEKCNQEDQAQREICISNVCANYDYINNDIMTPLPADNPLTNVDETAIEFYNRCLIEEKKEACYTCLKEYYMPAAYCEQTGDYISRSIMKYPAVVKRVRAGGDDRGEIWGPAQQDILGRGGECDDNTDAEPLNLALICRIMPEYMNLCRARCMSNGMTEEQLLDITDFRPNDIDCNFATVSGGGRNPWNPVSDGVKRVRGKCCGAFSVSNPTDYAMCVGGATTIEEPTTCEQAEALPLKDMPQCHCQEGERPIARVKNRLPEFICPTPDGLCWDRPGAPLQPECRTNCQTTSFEVPNMVRLADAYIRTNATPGGSMMYIGTERCQNNPDCIRLAQASFFEKIAKIFKPVMSFIEISAAGAAGPCTCDPGDNTCGPNFYCALWDPLNEVSTCTPTAYYEGYCAFTGTCKCNTTADCDSGEYCDDEASTEGECIAGEFTGLCKTAPVGENCTWPEDYSAPDPNGMICSAETYRSSDTKNCCTAAPIGAENRIGYVELECSLAGRSGQSLFLGMYDNDPEDCQTSAKLCIPCDRNDPGYPYYGTSLNQCDGKI